MWQQNDGREKIGQRWAQGREGCRAGIMSAGRQERRQSAEFGNRRFSRVNQMFFTPNSSEQVTV